MTTDELNTPDLSPAALDFLSGRLYERAVSSDSIVVDGDGYSYRGQIGGETRLQLLKAAATLRALAVYMKDKP